MKRFLNLIRWSAAAVFALVTVGLLVLGAVYLYVAPQLPPIDMLKDVRLQVPLRVYTREGALMAEFGEQRRTPVSFAETPELMIKAFLAAEDDRFFEHPGVDYQGLIRAAVELARTGEKRQGGSTITMQVARNFFLSAEKTFARKLNEIFLALKIERELSKAEILELYLNVIYLGQRAYGVGAAAQVYYGTTLDRLTLPQVAMIAGLPKAPSRYNPIADPERALARRDYVLRRMRDLGFIDEADFQAALETPDDARTHGLSIEVQAPFLAEMVRAEMVARHGDEAYTGGYRVVTTLRTDHQAAAVAALRAALLAYDERHGYRGPEQRVDPALHAETSQRDRLLADIPTVGGLRPALVTELGEKEALIYLGTVEGLQALTWEGLAWARPYIDDQRLGPAPHSAADVIQPGDVIRVHRDAEGAWRLAQIPEVEGALAALTPTDGAITALTGGFDFYHSKFNRAVQARRQPGSSFKPFIYSAALEKGFTPATLVNDAPVVFEDAALEATWRPENYSGRFYGPTRLREALVNSRNLVSIRVLRTIGAGYAIEHAGRFGFDTEALPRNLSLALGSAAAAPLDMASAYAVFANGGFRVEPYFIQRIEDAAGSALYEADPPVACPECEEQPAAPAPVTALGGVEAIPLAPPPEPAPVRHAERVLPPQNVYLMTSMMRDVIRRGTGRKAMALGRGDLAGKTGTTNDQQDAWFCGFNHAMVAAAWVGFDRIRPLGRGETGGRAALPMWMDFMKQALKGIPEQPLAQPPGMVTVRIDPASGLLAPAGQADAIFETFQAGTAPTEVAETGPALGTGHEPGLGEVPEQLF